MLFFKSMERGHQQVCDLLVKILLFVNENWGYLLVKGWCSDGKRDEAKILEKDEKRDKYKNKK